MKKSSNLQYSNELNQRQLSPHKIVHTQTQPKHLNDACRFLEVDFSTRCEGKPSGYKLKTAFSAREPSTDYLKEHLSSQHDFATERGERVNQRARELRRGVEADSRYLSSVALRRKSPLHPELSMVDDSHIDIPINYEDSSDLINYSSFNSVGSSHSNYIYQPVCGFGSQRTDLRGIGQWTEEIGSDFWSSWKAPEDVGEDQSLDLAEVHTLAVQNPFEQYLKTWRVEEGALNQIYSSLP